MKVFIAAFSVLILAGCHFGNKSEFEKGNLSATGINYLCWGEYHYNILYIGNFSKPFCKSPFDFVILLPNGAILKSTEFTEKNIQKIQGITIKRIEDDNNNMYRERNAIYYTLYFEDLSNKAHVSFCFKNAELILFYYWSEPFIDDDKINLQLGTIDGKKIYKFPLREWQLKELFGAPNNIRTSWLMP